jgi:DnaJ-domain-containing protein 1
MSNGSCPFCDKALGDGFLSGHICPSCGKPQPSRPSDTYFTALGAPETFRQDTALLQKHFYEASRVLHPDRFTSADPQSRSLSLERMSLINEAYRTLKNPTELRDYILALRGSKSEEKAKMPLDLAESWFELQDSLMEEPETKGDKILAFEKELGASKKLAETELAASELAYDQSNSEMERVKILESLALKSLELNYLRSMDRDIERIKKK